VQPNVAQTLGIDGGARLRHSVHERLAADESDLRVAGGLGDEMLAAAESDLEPDLGDGHREQGRDRCCDGLAQIHRKTRQQVLDQLGLTRAQPMTFAAPEKVSSLM
jgi:hypothetical protein